MEGNVGQHTEGYGVDGQAGNSEETHGSRGGGEGNDDDGDAGSHVYL